MLSSLDATGETEWCYIYLETWPRALYRHVTGAGQGMNVHWLKGSNKPWLQRMAKIKCWSFVRNADILNSLILFRWNTLFLCLYFKENRLSIAFGFWGFQAVELMQMENSITFYILSYMWLRKIKSNRTG